MSTKYYGLPDIDTAQDVFETADEPEHVLRPNDLGLDEDDAPTKVTSQDIDGSGLPERRRAERVFGRGTRKPDTKLIFRPRLPPLARHRSSSSSSSDEPLRETPAARLRRLKAELEEVEAEIQAGPSSSSMGNGGPGAMKENAEQKEGKRKSVLPPKPPVDLVAELGALRSRLNAVELQGGISPKTDNIDWGGRLKELGKPLGAEGSAGREVAGQGDLPSGDKTSLSDIDKRLASLEDTVGPADLGLAETPAPLLTTLNKLDHLLVLLTQPRHLDAISRRVKLLLVDLDRAAAASRRQPHAPVPEKGSNVPLSQAEYTSLQALFALLPRLDPLLPIIRPLLARLRSLSGLHAEAGEAVVSLRRVQDGDKRMEGEVKELMGVVEGVKSGLEDAGKAVERNWQGLEGRIKDLEGRIKALS